MRIPDSITPSHIRAAIRIIDEAGVPPRRQSNRYDLRVGHKNYPPKYVIAVANRLANRAELHNFTGGRQSNSFLIARGFADIRHKLTGERVFIEAEDEEDEKFYFEGRALFRLHRKLERDSRVAKMAKNAQLRQHGELICAGCGFSFFKIYGTLGLGYIEAHHTVPISKLRGRPTRLRDIALVCSNCHRMLHRSPMLLTIQELRRRIRHARSKNRS